MQASTVSDLHGFSQHSAPPDDVMASRLLAVISTDTSFSICADNAVIDDILPDSVTNVGLW